MASVVLAFNFDLSPFFDAAADLHTAHEALARRHGDVFRQLEREIERATDAVEARHLGDVDLGEHHFMITPPAVWTDLLRRCRQLGVLT